MTTHASPAWWTGEKKTGPSDPHELYCSHAYYPPPPVMRGTLELWSPWHHLALAYGHSSDRTNDPILSQYPGKNPEKKGCHAAQRGPRPASGGYSNYRREGEQRTTTRDIDYIARSFSSEWAQRAFLKPLLQFGLGADWMNSDADVALPMATDPTTGAIYDPIHAASIQTGESLTVYTSPNGLLKLVSVTSFWTVALKMVRYNPVDREDIWILLRSGTQMRQLHWTPARLEIWLLGTCWAMGYAGYDHERIKEMRRRMIEVVAEVNRWDPHAVTDDGRGDVVPLRPESGAYPPGIAYRTRKTKKKTKMAAVTTWPNQWTCNLPSNPPQQWGPESPELWGEGVWRAAAKERKHGHMTSWIPFLKNTESQSSLRSTRHLRRRQYYNSDEDSDSHNSDSDSDSDSDDSDWLRREQLKWGTTGRGPHVAGIGGRLPAQRRGLHVQRNDSDRCADSHPQLLRSWLYPGSQERQRSPPVRQVQPGPDMNQVAAGMNALGLYNI
ncbi:hypothetical protein B0H14DRAFT_3585491 [Mycena olivaceomarginata]|nr:hypothetical protein B0H14DRAFT_3585491 [Mycena olivaceomarginata]